MNTNRNWLLGAFSREALLMERIMQNPGRPVLEYYSALGWPLEASRRRMGILKSAYLVRFERGQSHSGANVMLVFPTGWAQKIMGANSVKER